MQKKWMFEYEYECEIKLEIKSRFIFFGWDGKTGIKLG